MPDGSPQLINRLRALINFYISVTHRSKVSVSVFAKHRDQPSPPSTASIGVTCIAFLPH